MDETKDEEINKAYNWLNQFIIYLRDELKVYPSYTGLIWVWKVYAL